ncbi:hypothetical protein COP2_010145 [Malus domestica]
MTIVKAAKFSGRLTLSLFEGFATIVRTQAKSPKGSIENLQPKLPESQVHSDGASRNHFATVIKRLR